MLCDERAKQEERCKNKVIKEDSGMLILFPMIVYPQSSWIIQLTYELLSKRIIA